jgi:hypothetical protein
MIYFCGMSAMRFVGHRILSFALAILLAALPCSSLPRGPHEKEKVVWNYDGGILLNTNGSIENGPCFRISGRVTAPNFFDDLKRIDTKEETIFRRGTENITTFPDQITLAFIVYDHYDRTCPPQDEEARPRLYLTRELMNSMHIGLYWKRGLDLRPVGKVAVKYFSVDPVAPVTVAAVPDLPERFRWSYEFAIPSGGVPLTDSLVIIFRTPDKRMAVRVAARM